MAILKEKILVPLAMQNTGSYCLIKDSLLNSKGYRLTSLNQFIPNVEGKVCEFFPDGGIYSTADDMILFWAALFGGKMIKENTLKLMLSEVKENSQYGLGIELNKIFETPAYGHNGSTPYIKSDYRYYPQDKYHVVFLANTSAFNSRQLAKNIYAVLGGYKIDHPVLPLGNYLTSVFDAKGIKSLKSDFNQLLAKNNYKIENQDLLNTYGYDLLGAKRIDEAIEIFSINVDLFPKNPNVYDSLGEAYLAKGNKEKAKFYYQKVLGLDPGNINAKKALENL